MRRYSGLSAVSMFELLMGAFLSNFGKAETIENFDGLFGRKHWPCYHSGNLYALCSYEFRINSWFTIFKQHFNDLFQVHI